MALPNFDHLKIDTTRDKRSEAEENWVSFQPYLLSKGYRLRPRYQPDWIPSWKSTQLNPAQCEDGQDRMPRRVMDATRIQDEQQVVIKMVIPTAEDEGKDEFATIQYFSTPPLKNDPSNHIVPLVDSFPIPGIDSGYFLVMPLLSGYDECMPFYNLAEVHDFLQQIFDGTLFMHSHHVAHCDIASPNILMDARPLYDEPFHPFFQTLSVDIKRQVYPKYRRSQKGTRYYFIDFGYAKLLRDSNAPRMATGRHAREVAPEQIMQRLYNPFAVDVYQLGTMIKKDLVPKFPQLRFLSPLIEEMTQYNPVKRPKMESARASMNTAFLGLSGWRYRWPLVPDNASFIARWRTFFTGLSEEAKHIMRWIINIVLQRKPGSVNLF